MALRKLSLTHNPDAPRTADTLYHQYITEQDVRWEWWKNGYITRDDEVVIEHQFNYSLGLFNRIMREHDGDNAFPPRGRITRQRRKNTVSQDDDDIDF